MRDLKASLLLYALFAFQVIDWAETTYMLGFGGIEANPFMVRMFAVSPWLALLPKLGVVALGILIYRGMRNSKYALRLLAVPVVLSGMPVVWNAVQLYLAGLL